jgi:hypothetical protein
VILLKIKEKGRTMYLYILYKYILLNAKETEVNIEVVSIDKPCTFWK